MNYDLSSTRQSCSAFGFEPQFTAARTAAFTGFWARIEARKQGHGKAQGSLNMPNEWLKLRCLQASSCRAELEADEGEQRWEEKLKRVAKPKPDKPE